MSAALVAVLLGLLLLLYALVVLHLPPFAPGGRLQALEVEESRVLVGEGRLAAALLGLVVLHQGREAGQVLDQRRLQDVGVGEQLHGIFRWLTSNQGPCDHSVSCDAPVPPGAESD